MRVRQKIEVKIAIFHLGELSILGLENYTSFNNIAVASENKYLQIW